RRASPLWPVGLARLPERLLLLLLQPLRREASSSLEEGHQRHRPKPSPPSPPSLRRDRSAPGCLAAASSASSAAGMPETVETVAAVEDRRAPPPEPADVTAASTKRTWRLNPMEWRRPRWRVKYAATRRTRWVVVVDLEWWTRKVAAEVVRELYASLSEEDLGLEPWARL